MEMLMTQWQKLSSAYAQLQLREKQLIFWVGLALIVYLFFWFGISPQWDKVSRLDKDIVRKESELSARVIQKDALNQALSIDYAARIKRDIDIENKKLLELDTKLAKLNDGFVAANKMPELLITLLNEQGNVRMVEFKVAPRQTVQFGEGELQSAALFRHNMTLKIEGSFFDLRDYLARIQASDEKVVVTKFHYTVEKYPNATLTLHLATVSNNETFISL
jgi:MSHA biogenesis protein MshJ